MSHLSLHGLALFQVSDFHKICLGMYSRNCYWSSVCLGKFSTQLL